MTDRAAARVEFLGIQFDRMPLAEVEQWLGARGGDSPYAYVITPNVDHVVRLSAAPDDVLAAYAEADLCLCDSRVLARLAQLAGVDLPLAPGSDLCAHLFARLLRSGDRVALIGGRTGEAATLAKRFPEIDIVQHRPPMGLRDDARARSAAVDAAVSAKARITLFAVGSPQQELLAHEMAMRPDARGTGLCIGASVDFLSGAQRRAPGIVQRLSLEWAWRLASDPRRLARRYLVEGPAVFPLVWRWRRERRRRG